MPADEDAVATVETAIPRSPARLGRRVGERPRAWALRCAIGGTIAFGSLFIVRASTVVDGQRTFTLFDDALVSMRYAHNLARGQGLVWNAGQPGVEGYTNLLWTLWLTVLHLTGLPVRLIGLFVSLSGLGLLVANLVLVAALCRRVAPDRPRVTSCALLLTATCYPLLFWTLRGMEVGLVAVVLSAATLLALRVTDGHLGSLRWLALVMVVGVLTRSDVAIPLCVIGGFAVWRTGAGGRARVALATSGGVLGAAALQTALRVRWYGQALPNTYNLKLAGIPLSDRLHRGLAVTLLLLSLEILGPIALVIVALTTSSAQLRRLLVLPVATLSSCVVYAAYVGGDAWEWMRIADRYVAPALPLLFIVAGVGFDRLVSRRTGSSSDHLLKAAALLGAAALVAAADPFPHDLLQLGERSTDVFAGPLMIGALGLLALALWLRSGPTIRPETVERVSVAVCAGALVMATSGAALLGWRSSAGDHVRDDAAMASIAAAVRESTGPDTTVAVVWAGSVPYFSDRPAIDLLGKSDPVVARSRPHAVALQPGHVRWDYGYSIGTLRPDLVIGLWSPTRADEDAMTAWGYTRVVGEVWARRDATGVDVEGLKRRLTGLHAPTVL